MTHIAKYQQEAEKITWHMEHEKQQEMAKKSNVVSYFSSA